MGVLFMIQNVKNQSCFWKVLLFFELQKLFHSFEKLDSFHEGRSAYNKARKSQRNGSNPVFSNLFENQFVF